jgi:hypothetical protein
VIDASCKRMPYPGDGGVCATARAQPANIRMLTQRQADRCMAINTPEYSHGSGPRGTIFILMDKKYVTAHCSASIASRVSRDEQQHRSSYL